MTTALDAIVVGGGIVGMATAWQLQRRQPDWRLALLEKEAGVGTHQSSRNSGVLHSGIYYAPGSLKAKNCVAGRRAMVEFCAEHGIAHETCGKVIVATHADELPRLDAILARGAANGVRCEKIEPDQLAELEPHVRGVRAIHVPDAGIADFGAVVRELRRQFEAAGGVVHTDTHVTRIIESDGEVRVETKRGTHCASAAIQCTGLHADRVARRSGMRSDAFVAPFRGEFFEFTPDSQRLCNNLIYPVPNPAFPFLGVHFTKTVYGTVEAGPNAVLALAREGYTRTTVNVRDLLETLTNRGFLRLAARHWRTGLAEQWRSLRKAAFVAALQKLIPAVRSAHLRPAPAGVRAQAITRDGKMVDDFLIEESARIVHVLNAASPAATASLQIGDKLAGRLATKVR